MVAMWRPFPDRPKRLVIVSFVNTAGGRSAASDDAMEVDKSLTFSRGPKGCHVDRLIGLP